MMPSPTRSRPSVWRPAWLMIIGGLAVSLSGGTPCLHAQLTASGATASFRGSLPPKASVRLEVAQTQALRARLDKVSADFDSVRQHRYAADVDIFLKAVRYALE